jgi:hypothetical protein
MKLRGVDVYGDFSCPFLPKPAGIIESDKTFVAADGRLRQDASPHMLAS